MEDEDRRYIVMYIFGMGFGLVQVEQHGKEAVTKRIIRPGIGVSKSGVKLTAFPLQREPQFKYYQPPRPYNNGESCDTNNRNMSIPMVRVTESTVYGGSETGAAFLECGFATLLSALALNLTFDHINKLYVLLSLLDLQIPPTRQW